MSLRDQVLEKTAEVPALPAATSRVIEVLQDREASVVDVMRVIEFDPGLTSNVLRLANSAYFAGSREIVSLRDAGVRLGLNRVFQLVMTSSISAQASQPVRGYGLCPGELFEHAVSAALAAELLAEALGKKIPPEAFTAGLLHDIGKTVLGTFVEVDVKPILDVAFKEGVSFEVAERRILGIDHAEVGAILLERWKLPRSIVEAVRKHHNPDEVTGEDYFLVALVHVADNLCLESGIGMGIDGLHYAPSPGITERMHLKPLACEGVVCKMLTQLDELRGILGIATRR